MEYWHQSRFLFCGGQFASSKLRTTLARSSREDFPITTLGFTMVIIFVKELQSHGLYSTMALNIRSLSSSTTIGTVCWQCATGGRRAQRAKSSVILNGITSSMDSRVRFAKTSYTATAPSGKRGYSPSQTNHQLAGQYARARSLTAARNAALNSAARSPKGPNNVRRTREDLENQRRLREDVERTQRAKDLEKQQHRSWKAGEVYAPHDLSPEEMKKWKKRKSPTMDAFDALGIDPLDQYKVRRSNNVPSI
jgi:hypothetical protein